MTGIERTEEPFVRNPHLPLPDCQLAGPGDEFHWDGFAADIDVSDLECHAMLVIELNHDSESQSMQSTVHI